MAVGGSACLEGAGGGMWPHRVCVCVGGGGGNPPPHLRSSDALVHGVVPAADVEGGVEGCGRGGGGALWGGPEPWTTRGRWGDGGP